MQDREVVLAVARLTSDVNKKGRDGDTPLQLAVDRDNTAAVAALASVPNVDWSAMTKLGETALDWAR